MEQTQELFRVRRPGGVFAASGRLRSHVEASVGAEFLDHEVEVWRALCAVLDTAEIGAGHWRAVKPSRATS